MKFDDKLNFTKSFLPPFKLVKGGKTLFVKSSLPSKVIFTPHFVVKGKDRPGRPHDYVVW